MISLFLVSSFLFSPSSILRADGGVIRLSEQKGSYRITVFSAPTPLRAGPMDISVLVQDSATGELTSEVQVAIKTVRHDYPATKIHYSATREAATNKLYYAANLDLPGAGWYSFDVSIEGALGEANVRFEVEAAESLPPWLAFWPWVCWPALAILLFSIHQVLVRRRSRIAAHTMIDIPPGPVN